MTKFGDLFYLIVPVPYVHDGALWCHGYLSVICVSAFITLYNNPVINLIHPRHAVSISCNMEIYLHHWWKSKRRKWLKSFFVEVNSSFIVYQDCAWPDDTRVRASTVMALVYSWRNIQDSTDEELFKQSYALVVDKSTECGLIRDLRSTKQILNN